MTSIRQAAGCMNLVQLQGMSKRRDCVAEDRWKRWCRRTGQIERADVPQGQEADSPRNMQRKRRASSVYNLQFLPG